MHEIVHVLAIVVAQTKELLYMSDTSEGVPLTNGCQLIQIHTDLAVTNYVAQVINLALRKYIFLHLCT